MSVRQCVGCGCTEEFCDCTTMLINIREERDKMKAEINKLDNRAAEAQVRYLKAERDRDHWRTLALAAKEALEKYAKGISSHEPDGTYSVAPLMDMSIAKKALAPFLEEKKS